MSFEKLWDFMWENEIVFWLFIVFVCIFMLIYIIKGWSNKSAPKPDYSHITSHEPPPTAGIYCTVCNTKNPTGQKHCISCGSKLYGTGTKPTEKQHHTEIKTILCPHCSSANPSNKSYCSSCGKKLS